MVKKSVLVLAFAALAVGGVFAQDGEGSKGGKLRISAGVGGFLGGDFGGGTESTVSMGGQDMKSTTEMPYFGGGGFAFFDATYAELTLGIYGGGGKMKQTSTGMGMDDQESDFSVMNFNIGLLGKYPFALNEKLSVFPLLGIEYDICLSAKDEDGNETKNSDGDENAGDNSALWFKLGAGLDFDVTEKVYLRFEALYGIRLESKSEKDMVDATEKWLKSMAPGADIDVKARLGHGLTAKLAVGFKL